MANEIKEGGFVFRRRRRQGLFDELLKNGELSG
jgi:hypothetical protein